MTTPPQPTPFQTASDALSSVHIANESAVAAVGAMHAETVELERLYAERGLALTGELAAHARTKQALVDALERIRVLENPTPVVTRLPFGIGINEKPTGNATPLPFTHQQLEADAGVTFAYLHEYFRYDATGVLTGAVSWAKAQLAAGRTPVLNIKVPGDDWVGAAAGKYDAAIKATSDAFDKLITDPTRQRIIIGVQGEADNDNKSWASFAAMIGHLIPLVKRAGRVEFWLCLTGWEQLYGTDTEWDLEDVYIEGVDGYGFDPYLSLGASTQTKFTDMATAYAAKYGAWAKEHDVQWGIFESGLGENAAKMTKFAAQTSTWLPVFAGACADAGATMFLYWNNRRALRSGEVAADVQDWRITKTMPANKHGQIIAAMRKWAPVR